MALSIRSATKTLAVVLSLATALPSVALADEASKAQREEAKGHFKRGLAHQQAGAYAEAIAEYQAAYAITPLPDMLFNIGQCHRLGGQRDQALFYYRRYLEQVPEGGASDDARAHVQTLEALPAQNPSKVHPVSPRATVVVPPNEPEPGGADERSSPTWRWIGLGGVGVGVVCLGVGAWQGMEAAAAADDVESAPMGTMFDEIAAREAEGKDAQTRMIVFTSVGAALVVAGGLTWYLAGSEDRSERRVSASPLVAPGLAGLSFSGRF